MPSFRPVKRAKPAGGLGGRGRQVGGRPSPSGHSGGNPGRHLGHLKRGPSERTGPGKMKATGMADIARSAAAGATLRDKLKPGVI